MASSINLFIDFQNVVLPSLPTPVTTFYLDNIDQQMPMNVEVLFFYTNPRSHSPVNTAQLFQTSLAKLLVPYHYAAGRYQVNEKQRRLEIVSNRAGAYFAAASTGMSLSELGDLSLPNPEFRKLVVYPPNIKSIDQVPLLTVQVTEFACGGYVLGFSACHCLFDGFELINLFRSYARIIEGDGELHRTLKPVLDKTHLDPATFSAEVVAEGYVHPELVPFPDVPAKVLFDPADYTLAGNPLPAGFFFKSFPLTPSMLASLKRKGSSGGNTCTTFEALAAHLWQCRTKAMETAVNSEAPSKLFVSMSTRRMLQSALPAGFAGNSVVFAPCVDTSHREVCESSLAECVKKVQDSLGKVDEGFIRSQMSWCEGKHGMLNAPGGLLITTWSKVGFDSVDFGSGKPAYVAPLTTCRSELVVVLANCLGDGGVNVLMAMEFTKMNGLEKLLYSI